MLGPQPRWHPKASHIGRQPEPSPTPDHSAWTLLHSMCPASGREPEGRRGALHTACAVSRNPRQSQTIPHSHLLHSAFHVPGLGQGARRATGRLAYRMHRQPEPSPIPDHSAFTLLHSAFRVPGLGQGARRATGRLAYRMHLQPEPSPTPDHSAWTLLHSAFHVPGLGQGARRATGRPAYRTRRRPEPSPIPDHSAWTLLHSAFHVPGLGQGARRATGCLAYRMRRRRQARQIRGSNGWDECRALSLRETVPPPEAGRLSRCRCASVGWDGCRMVSLRAGVPARWRILATWRKCSAGWMDRRLRHAGDYGSAELRRARTDGGGWRHRAGTCTLGAASRFTAGCLPGNS